VRDPFPNNIIPQDRIHPIARNLLDFWPMPNQAPDEGCASYRCNFFLSPNLATDDFYNLATKVDHVFSEKTKMFVRYAQNFIHNETRDTLIEVADRVGLPIVHTRTVVFTQPASKDTALYDRIWIHQRGNSEQRGGGRSNRGA
jgi:hypothetical protein